VEYGLGVDLGTTYTAAAVRHNGHAEVARLGSRRAEIPSVVFVRPDGRVLIGEAAERRGAEEPGRLAREFKRRVGDPVPLLVGGSPYPAHALMARLLEEVLGTVTRQQEGPPAAITVTHPANWGPYKRELLGQAVRLAELDNVTLRAEPEAAAVRYAASERVRPGEIVAVYDLGGGTFDAAVLRKTEAGFELLGEPEGIEQLGGIDFDEAVLTHVTATLGQHITSLDPDDSGVIEALARLRRDCIEAKEALSYDTEVMVPVALPNLHTRVRLNRSEFEQMITPALLETIAAMRRAMRSAGIEPAQLRSVVLAGGSSRIPLVSQLLSVEFGRPIVLDPSPEHSIALGAALVTGRDPVTAAGTGVVVDPVAVPPAGPADSSDADAGGADGRRRSRMAILLSKLSPRSRPDAGSDPAVSGAAAPTSGPPAAAPEVPAPVQGPATPVSAAPVSAAPVSAAPVSAAPVSGAGASAPSVPYGTYGTPVGQQAAPADRWVATPPPDTPSRGVARVPVQPTYPQADPSGTGRVPVGGPTTGSPVTPVSGAPAGPVSAPPGGPYTEPHSGGGLYAEPTSGAPAGSTQPWTGHATPGIASVPPGGASVSGVPSIPHSFTSTPSAASIRGVPSVPHGFTSTPGAASIPGASSLPHGFTSTPGAASVPGASSMPHGFTSTPGAASVPGASSMPHGFTSTPSAASIPGVASIPGAASVSSAGRAAVPSYPSPLLPGAGSSGGSRGPVGPGGPGEPPPKPDRRRRLYLVGGIIALVVALVAAGAVAFLLTRGGGGGKGPGGGGPTGAVVGQWERKADLPVSIEGAAMATWKGKLWVAGGQRDNDVRLKISEVFVYDPAADSWTNGPPLPRQISHAALVPTPTGLYFIAGWILDGGSTQVLRLNDAGTGWEEQPPLPETRVAGVGGYTGKELIYAGGTRKGPQPADNVWALRNGAWVEIGKLQTPRQKLMAAGNGVDTIWILGGRNIQTNEKYGAIDVVNADGVTKSNRVLDPPIDSAAGIWVEGSGVCLVGGQTPNGGFSNWWCEERGLEDKLPALDPQRGGLAASMIGRTVYVVGGYGKGFVGLSRLEAYTFPG